MSFISQNLFFFLISQKNIKIDFENFSMECLKNQPCDVIKMNEMRGEVGKKTPKKEMDNPTFL